VASRALWVEFAKKAKKRKKRKCKNERVNVGRVTIPIR
jgi:hypothetical protein